MVLGFLAMGEAMQVNFLQEYKRLCLLRDIPGAKKQKVDAKALARRMLARQVPLLVSSLNFNNTVHVTLDVLRLVRNISRHCGSSARLVLPKKRFKLNRSMTCW